MKRLIIAVAVLIGLSACSSSGPALPKTAAFHPGVCRQAAPALLATARRANNGGGHPESLAGDLATQQKLLKQFATQPDIQALVTAIGFVRFQVDAHSYTDQLRKNVEAATRTAITACTSK